MLAKGSDGNLKALAEKDLAQPREQIEQLELADAWWKFGEKQHGLIQKRIFLRAAEWRDHPDGTRGPGRYGRWHSERQQYRDRHADDIERGDQQ